jgi:hypothetical protein
MERHHGTRAGRNNQELAPEKKGTQYPMIDIYTGVADKRKA